jgi:hypothetical protein
MKHTLAAFSKPYNNRRGFIIESPNLELEPGSHWIGETALQTNGERSRRDHASLIDDVLVYWGAPSGLIRGY